MAKKKVKFPAKIVTHYIKRLQSKIDINGVLLFGSFADGHPTKDSDVDLAVISSDFTRKSFDSRLDFLTDMRDKLSCQIAMDVIGYTPKEFDKAEEFSAILDRAKKKGKWLVKPKV